MLTGAPFKFNMHTDERRLPAPPTVPHDFIFMLTYTAGPEETRAEVVAEQLGIDLECATERPEQ